MIALVSHRRDSLEFRWPYGEQSSLLAGWHRRNDEFLKCLDAYLSSGQTTIQSRRELGFAMAKAVLTVLGSANLASTLQLEPE